jgi:hypothetical protein
MRKSAVKLGVALFLFASLFLYGTLWYWRLAVLVVVYLLIMAVGTILILLGMVSRGKNDQILNKKRILSLSTLVIVASTLVPYSLWTLSNVGAYKKAIIRNTSKVEEANALTIVENSNYSDIFDLQRFYTWNSNETWSYTWAYFIDTQVIEYYDDRFENLKERLRPRRIHFHYEANVSTWDQIQVVYVNAPEGGNIYDDAIQVLSSNGSVLFENAQYTGPGWGMLFACRNDSEYQQITAEEIDFSLSRSYVIEMTLEYDETYGPLAAFFVDVYQIIIVDQDFVPFLFCVQSKHFIS